MKTETEKINFWVYYSKFSKRNKTYVKKKFGSKFNLKKNSVSSRFFRGVLNFEEQEFLAELCKMSVEEFDFKKNKTSKILENKEKSL